MGIAMKQAVENADKTRVNVSKQLQCGRKRMQSMQRRRICTDGIYSGVLGIIQCKISRNGYRSAGSLNSFNALKIGEAVAMS